jgi:hypothetical protein
MFSDFDNAGGRGSALRGARPYGLLLFWVLTDNENAKNFK